MDGYPCDLQDGRSRPIYLSLKQSHLPEGLARDPKELLVVAKWPDNVTAFLVSCEQLSGPEG